MASQDYASFLRTKQDLGDPHGFEPIEIPAFLFPFQQALVEWSIRKGRAAIFADCGLGKTPMQLVWADNVVRKTGKPVLILTPLAVSAQTVREADKFGLPARQSRDGSIVAPITVTNYEKLHLFRASDFAGGGVVCDESSCLKDFKSKTKAAVTEFMRTIPYRLLCTATAAPNDFPELGTSAEALGEMGFQDMITRWFKQSTSKDHLGWGRTKYVMRPHGEHDFWRWVCSWARACRKPSDLGFEDDRFVLPELITREHVIETRKARNGFLFPIPARGLQEEREERRITIDERCQAVAELIAHNRPAICWCHLNPEGDYLEKIIPGAIQVSGQDSDEAKEEKLLAFTSGQARVMVSKPVVFGFGLNLQHCAHETFFPSHSYEQVYQAIRRCYRFGQTQDVTIDMVSSEGEVGVMTNYQKKAVKAEEMFSRLVALMNAELQVERTNPYINLEEVPPWLYSTRSSLTDSQFTTATAST